MRKSQLFAATLSLMLVAGCGNAEGSFEQSLEGQQVKQSFLSFPTGHGTTMDKDLAGYNVSSITKNSDGSYSIDVSSHQVDISDMEFNLSADESTLIPENNSAQSSYGKSPMLRNGSTNSTSSDQTNSSDSSSIQSNQSSSSDSSSTQSDQTQETDGQVYNINMDGFNSDGIDIFVNKVVLRSDKTLVYVTLTNNTGDSMTVLTPNIGLIQGTSQIKAHFRDPDGQDFPAIVSSGVQTQAILAFDSVDPTQTALTLDFSMAFMGAMTRPNSILVSFSLK